MGSKTPNVSLSKLDILGEIPEEYREKFDVVHARLLVQVVNQAGSDPVPVIRNMMKLLSMFRLHQLTMVSCEGPS